MTISVKEYAEKYKITQQAVYQKIKQGSLKIIVKDKKKYIEINDTENIINENFKQVEQVDLKHFNDLIKIKDSMIEELKKDKEQLYKQIEQSNILQLKTLESLNQLEYKTQEIEKQLEKEKKKNWIEKLFKK